MKNYFKFNLNSRDFLIYWLLYLIFCVLPTTLMDYYQKETQDVQSVFQQFAYLGGTLFIYFLVLIFYFFFGRITLRGLEYKEQNLVFKGSLTDYIVKVLIGMFLTVITFGIYSPWFIANICQFFASNTTYNSDKFRFTGRGLNLFLIMTLILIPTFLIGFLAALAHSNLFAISVALYFLVGLLTFFLFGLYIYLVYKWFIDFEYQAYRVTMESEFWGGYGKCLLELFLTLITCGLYFPMAYLKLYKYFVEHTVARSPEETRQFRVDSYSLDDFFFIWGQLLLTIITCLIYTPWAMNKIWSLYIGRTSLVNQE